MTIGGRDNVPQETAHDENAVSDDEISPPARMSAFAQNPADTVAAAEAVPLALESSTSPSSPRELRALLRDAGFIESSTAVAPEQHSNRHGISWLRRLSNRAMSEVMLTRENIY